MWPRYSQRSGGDKARDQKSGGKGRQLATSASKESKMFRESFWKWKEYFQADFNDNSG